MKWQEAANQFLGSVSPVSTLNFVRSAAPRAVNPIDHFIERRRSLLSFLSANLQTYPDYLGGYILVALISETEEYVKSVLAGILSICPTSKRKASSATVSFASVSWGGIEGLPRSLFDHKSLADADSIKKSLATIGCDVKAGSSIATPLQEYDHLCELRHAVVHTGSFVTGKNAVVLDLPSNSSGFRVFVDIPQIQEAAHIVSSLVYAINSELFELVCGRWAVEWRRSGSWNTKREKQLFARIWQLFVSQHEPGRDRAGSLMSKTICRNRILSQFGIR
jgi:hypothetical protein